MIEKRGNKYLVLSKSGKTLGEFPSRAEAEERLRQIEAFKGDKQFFDFAPFSGERVVTEEGYLEVNVVATAVGVQDYDGAELGFKPGTKVGLNRTADTVFNQETIDSFKGKPVTIGHDGEMINADTHKLFTFGNVMGDAFRIDGQRLGVRLLVTDADTVRRIQDGELIGISLGYTCNQTERSGSLDGSDFSLVTDGPMIINHVTLLPASMPPRVEQARILDQQTKGNSVMEDEDIEKIVKALAPTIDKMVADALADAMKKKADADDEDERKKADADDEDERKKADADDENEEERKKADADDENEEERKKDAAAKFDAQVNDAANLRAQVLTLCDVGATSKTNTELLKDKLGDDYVTDDQAIGYLVASAKFDTDGRSAARLALSDNKGGSKGGAKIFSLDAIKHLDKKEA